MAINEGKAVKWLETLFDGESFVELYALSCGDIVTGYGLIDGAVVYAFAENGGGMSGEASDKLRKLYKNAIKNGSPVVGIYDSKGGYIKEGRRVLSAYGEIAGMTAELSGVVPQISVITGLCAGADAVLACSADFVIMSKDAELFITPPFNAADKVKGAGGSGNAAQSGTASVITEDGEGAVAKARELIKILPQNNLELSGNDLFEENDAPVASAQTCVETLTAVADKNSLIEIAGAFGAGAYTALGSVSWRTVGFVSADGRLNADDCVKIARFVSFCDAFSIPVLTVINTEGFEQSSAAELNGLIKCAAQLVQTYATATAPKISLIKGNAIGSAYVALSANADFTFCFKEAVIYPVTPTAAKVLIGEAFDENETNAESAAKEGFVDRIIEPEETRRAVLSALDLLSGKRINSPNRKHATNN